MFLAFRWQSFFQVAVISLVVAIFSTSAFAQWKWIDSEGKTQYTQLPPPPQTPRDKILKTPRDMKDFFKAKTKQTEVGSPSELLEKVRQKQKEEEEAKLRAEKLEEDQRKRQETLKKERMAIDCKSKQNYLSLISSGRPIRKTNEKNEYALISDSQRKEELARTEQFIGKNCN